MKIYIDSFKQRMINKLLNETGQYRTDIDIKNSLIKRIPFLNDYNIIEHPRYPGRLEAKRIVYNDDVKVKIGDNFFNFPSFNVSSEIRHYSRSINKKNLHVFSIKNKFHTVKPHDMDELSYRVFLAATNKVEDILSYNRELIIKQDEMLSKADLDKIINEMNGVLFNIEKYTNENYIDLFYTS
jgi:hypothetical protein